MEPAAPTFVTVAVALAELVVVAVAQLTIIQDCLLMQAMALAAVRHLFKVAMQSITAVTEPAAAKAVMELVAAAEQVAVVESAAAVALLLLDIKREKK